MQNAECKMQNEGLTAEEIVKSLRVCGDAKGGCSECAARGKGSYKPCIQVLLDCAANLIEEQTKRIGELKTHAGMSGGEKQNTVTKRKKRQRRNLRNKELRRQLMGIGVQRNDADAFIRAYRAIEKGGAQWLCQSIMVPPIQVETRYGRAEKLVAQTGIPREIMRFMTPTAFERETKRELVQMLARELLESGAAKVLKWPDREGTVAVRAEVLVVTEVEE